MTFLIIAQAYTDVTKQIKRVIEASSENKAYGIAYVQLESTGYEIVKITRQD